MTSAIGVTYLLTQILNSLDFFTKSPAGKFGSFVVFIIKTMYHEKIHQYHT